MKWLLLFLAFATLDVTAQSTGFPQSWTGNWKGELEWYKTGQASPQKIMMELKIKPTDSAGQYQWQIIYGSADKDNRPYTLIAKDTANGHWVIDEHNGIVLDQYWVGQRFSGAFTVMGNTIINSYWMEGDKLLLEFFSIKARPVTTSGKGTEDSPQVDSYRMSSYQKAVLTRSN